MIKFFRKIRLQLINQKQMGKPALPASARDEPDSSSGRLGRYFKYAIGEIILVVLGILIALQINNWNEQRKVRNKEHAYLLRIKQDLLSDKEALKLNKDFYQDVFEAGSLVLSRAENRKTMSASNWDVLTSFFHASQIWPILMQSSTYEELRSSGELSIIQNVTIRNRLPFYHGNGLRRYNETMGIDPPYRKMVRGLIPCNIQNYMWDHCHVTDGDNQTIMYCDPMISELQAEEIINDLLSNSDLINELRYYISNIKVGQTTLIEQGKLCESLINEIEKELKHY